MKKIKKNLFRFAIAGAFVFGGLLSMVPLNLNAGELFNRIPCDSNAEKCEGFSYVDCASCNRIPDWDGYNSGRCKPSPN